MFEAFILKKFNFLVKISVICLIFMDAQIVIDLIKQLDFTSKKIDLRISIIC